MSFACVPDCVFSSFRSTQIFIRHSDLADWGGLAWREIILHRFLNVTEENQNLSLWGQQKLLQPPTPKTWNPMWATWGKCMVIQTCRVFLAPHRFRDFIRFCFRMGLKGMILTWISKCQERTMQIRNFSTMQSNIGKDLQALRFPKDSCFFHLKHLKKAQLGHKVDR